MSSIPESQGVRPPCIAVHDTYGVWPLVSHLLEGCLPHRLAPDLRVLRSLPGKVVLPPFLNLSFAMVKPPLPTGAGPAGLQGEGDLTGTEDDHEGVAPPVLHLYMVHCEAETDHKVLARKISEWISRGAGLVGSPARPAPAAPLFLIVLVSCNATAASRSNQASPSRQQEPPRGSVSHFSGGPNYFVSHATPTLTPSSAVSPFSSLSVASSVLWSQRAAKSFVTGGGSADAQSEVRRLAEKMEEKLRARFPSRVVRMSSMSMHDAATVVARAVEVPAHIS